MEIQHVRVRNIVKVLFLLFYNKWEFLNLKLNYIVPITMHGLTFYNIESADWEDNAYLSANAVENCCTNLTWIVSLKYLRCSHAWRLFFVEQ
jgi:hypothetical protein